MRKNHLRVEFGYFECFQPLPLTIGKKASATSLIF